MNFGDFTESTGPSATDFLAGYATGGGAGSDRRYQVGNLLTALTSVEIKGAGDVELELGRIDGNASNPAIHFHSGATAVDYDSALVATGGASGSPTAAGEGSLQFVGAGGFNPAMNDGAALGTAALSWSDAFLASGGVINYANGNYTVTHSSALLTFETTATAALARFQNDDGGALGSVIDLFHNSGSAANSDVISRLSFSGKSSTGVTRQYAGMDITITDVTNASEDAVIDLMVIVNGSLSASKLRVDTGGASIAAATAIPAGGNTGMSLRFSTSSIGIFAGSGAPSVSAAKGSLYLRTDGSTTNDRAYINTNGATTWTAITTVA